MAQRLMHLKKNLYLNTGVSENYDYLENFQKFLMVNEDTQSKAVRIAGHTPDHHNVCIVSYDKHGTLVS